MVDLRAVRQRREGAGVKLPDDWIDVYPRPQFKRLADCRLGLRVETGAVPRRRRVRNTGRRPTPSRRVLKIDGAWPTTMKRGLRSDGNLSVMRLADDSSIEKPFTKRPASEPVTCLLTLEHWFPETTQVLLRRLGRLVR